MKKMFKYLFVPTLMLLWGCAAAPVVQAPATLPPTPLWELIARVDQYKGGSVVLGGYVAMVENRQHQSEIVVVQAPLETGQRPKAKDLSEGRVVFVVNGFIDPEVYTKGRQITAAGKILGASGGDDRRPYAHLLVDVADMHLWPVEEAADPRWADPWYPYRWGPWYDPWYGPWGPPYHRHYRH